MEAMRCASGPRPMTMKNTEDANAGSLKQPGSVTELDGYRAAGILIEKAMREADLKCPKRIPRNISSAAVRYGYYKGLLLAHCQMALGEHANHELNKPVIRRILQSQNGQAQRPGAQGGSLATETRKPGSLK